MAKRKTVIKTAKKVGPKKAAKKPIAKKRPASRSGRTAKPVAPKRIAAQDRLLGLPAVASMLGRRLDSPELVAFMRKWKVKPYFINDGGYRGGEINLRDRGFDLILAFDDKFGRPIGSGNSHVWACLMRFFSPESCQGKRNRRPWTKALLDGVGFPLTRDSVVKHFGKPQVQRRDARHLDEYHRGNCRIRFCYRKDGPQVGFMELALKPDAVG